MKQFATVTVICSAQGREICLGKRPNLSGARRRNIEALEVQDARQVQ